MSDEPFDDSASSPDATGAHDPPAPSASTTTRPLRERVAGALLFVGLAFAVGSMARDAPRTHSITLVLEGERETVDHVDVEVFTSDSSGELLHRISKHFESSAPPTLTFDVKTAEHELELNVRIDGENGSEQTRRHVVLHEDGLGSRVVVRASARRGSDGPPTSH